MAMTPDTTSKVVLMASVVAALMLGSAGNALADVEIANSLLQSCQPNERLISCLGCIAAISDFTNHLTCTPPTANGRQLSDIVVKYLENDPEKRHLSGSDLVASALAAALPCK